MERIYVRDKNFIDESGRVRIFHGVNLVCKDRSMGYVYDLDKSDLKELRGLGFNLIRLGIIWDGLEPKPGLYNEAYLDKIEKLLNLCAEHEIYVLLDMHQDLFSVRYSDGAPEWATLTDGLPEPEKGSVWSDAYMSMTVQRAFDHFWANDPAPDGLGLQDHLASCWKLIAQRFGKRPEVLGYDLLNEPFPSTVALPIFHSLLTAFSQVESQISGKSPKTINEMIEMFSNLQSRLEALRILDNKKLYKDLVLAAESYVKEFDARVLMPFYERVAKAIRSVTSYGIIFMENNYFSNIGIPSGIKPITVNGKHEELQGFAPHGYDLVVDTPLVGSGASENRVEVIFESHYETQQRLNLPVVVGEWGGFGTHEDITRHCLFLLDTFDKYLWSWTYWAWLPKESNKTKAARLLTRVYPTAVAGDLISFHYDQMADSFFMGWIANTSINTPTMICLPEGLRGRKVEIIPECTYDVKNVVNTPHIIIKPKHNGRYSIIIK